MVVSLQMGWRHVLFANWPTSPRIVESHLPEALSLDTYDGAAWLSVIPFTNVDVRPRIFPSAIGLPVPELNLRTYVRHDETPGVYFFSLDAQGILAVLGARLFHHLPYYYARIDLEQESGGVRFTSRRRHPGERPVHFEAAYRPDDGQFSAEPGTLTWFLTERYRYYTEDQNGRIRHAEIQHDPWPLFDVEVEIEENTLFRANGFEPPDTEPVHFYSPGVDTVASNSRRSSDGP
ncbi:YqjF family protein [Natrialbaceae archaeon GCM10025810]|uniref:YqjF family protein n=1 Tax=Halovalidus salilacus TaxID=3075124 RepID=UPI003614A79E